MRSAAREVLAQIYRAAVAGADPYIRTGAHLAVEPGWLVIGGARYNLPEIKDIYVLGAGKAAYGMARAAQDALGGFITGGLVVTKDGHGGPLGRIRLVEASHPLPDGRGVDAARAILGIAAGAGEEDLVIGLFSGGASALMALPAEGISLADKQAVTQLLLRSGADIAEMNCVRKHLSAVKGGRLAEAASPARVATLLISDVPGSDIGVIASGPTAPDVTTFTQAAEILRMRGVYGRVPEPVRALLEKGRVGALSETPKPGDDIFARVRNTVAADNKTALIKAAELAGYMGYRVSVIDAELCGEAKDAGRHAALEAIKYRGRGGAAPACLLTGGETTVTVRGGGLGGRNQEMALAFLQEISGHKGIYALFAGTDGTDGPTDAAGAFADEETADEARAAGLSAEKYLADNDSYSFFKEIDGLFKTGATGTNVMDIGIILVE